MIMNMIRADEREREEREYCKKKHIKGDDKDPRGSGAASYNYKHKSTNTNANVKCATYTIRVVWALILNLPRLIMD